MSSFDVTIYKELGSVLHKGSDQLQYLTSAPETPLWLALAQNFYKYQVGCFCLGDEGELFATLKLRETSIYRRESQQTRLVFLNHSLQACWEGKPFESLIDASALLEESESWASQTAWCLRWVLTCSLVGKQVQSVWGYVVRDVLVLPSVLQAACC